MGTVQQHALHTLSVVLQASMTAARKASMRPTAPTAGACVAGAVSPVVSVLDVAVGGVACAVDAVVVEVVAAAVACVVDTAVTLASLGSASAGSAVAAVTAGRVAMERLVPTVWVGSTLATPACVGVGVSVAVSVARVRAVSRPLQRARQANWSNVMPFFFTSGKGVQQSSIDSSYHRQGPGGLRGRQEDSRRRRIARPRSPKQSPKQTKQRQHAQHNATNGMTAAAAHCAPPFHRGSKGWAVMGADLQQRLPTAITSPELA